MRIVLALSGLALFGVPLDASPVESGGMRVSWSHQNDEIVFALSAPTEGWVAIGFNTVNDIVGAELVMVRVTDAVAYAEHRYVVAPGDHRPVSSFGRSSAVRAVGGAVSGRRVDVDLRLATDLTPDSGVSLVPGQRLYLIMAYSVSPDFDHHSRMRRHVRVEL